ncbi:Rrf2 family transcriptional regulator, partial [Omnitrophica bacterium]|nr:Rrf2 family transcriptional regulator [Candidatus Omnitrophota bacterium]
MFKLYSKGCQYTLHALSRIPVKEPGQKLTARTLCKVAGIPESFTRKMLQSLSQSGFLKAVPGPGGGYVLAKDPKKVSILDIIQAVDGKDAFDRCVMGLPACGDFQPCVI